MAKQRGYEIVHEYADVISGNRAKRPGLDQLLADARGHRFDILILGSAGREPIYAGYPQADLELIDTNVLDSRLILLEYRPVRKTDS